jgi:hypothetical protein
LSTLWLDGPITHGEQAIAFKQEFAKLDKADQMDGIQTH